jgi:hypothetical protein
MTSSVMSHQAETDENRRRSLWTSRLLFCSSALAIDETTGKACEERANLNSNLLA